MFTVCSLQYGPASCLWYKIDSRTACAAKSSTLFTSNMNCPKPYTTFKVSSPPYSRGRKNLCVALHAVNAFSIPRNEECPEKGFTIGIDKTNMENKLCIRDQKVTQENSDDNCFSVGARTKADDNAYEMQVVRCKSNGLTYEFPARCKTGASLGQCIGDLVTSSNPQKTQPPSGAR